MMRADRDGLVPGYARGGPWAAAAVLRTTRRSYELRDADGRLLAELDDDSVAVLDGQKVRFKFREIEVERRDGGRRLLARGGGGPSGAGPNGPRGVGPKKRRGPG